MHPQARDFTLFVKSILPEYFKNKVVLDVGSGDINGNIRFVFKDCMLSMVLMLRLFQKQRI